ncbi:DUF823 domain-containing adhesin, partial [Serratia liquefaciens]|uniref:adhesion domain-containing protein n=1 Tax=Serratia liquefaciens TaxID=614 RepID=UPI0032E05085
SVGKVTLVPKVGDKTFDKISTAVTLTPVLMEVTLDKTKAKVGEEIKLTIKTKTSDGKPYPDVPITVKSTGAVNRQKANEPITLKFNQSESFKGNTGSSGELSIQLSDPKGFGVETKFDIQASFGGESETQSESVVFTVITSPDTDKANYWGHMTETLSAADGTVFKRPMLVREVEGFNVPTHADSYVREEWSLVTYTDADRVLCRGKIGTMEQVNSVSKNKPVQKHGWPLDLWAWTSKTLVPGQHWTGDYTKGTATGALTDDNPGATALCIK